MIDLAARIRALCGIDPAEPPGAGPIPRHIAQDLADTLVAIAEGNAAIAESNKTTTAAIMNSLVRIAENQKSILRNQEAMMAVLTALERGEPRVLPCR